MSQSTKVVTIKTSGKTIGGSSYAARILKALQEGDVIIKIVIDGGKSQLAVSRKYEEIFGMFNNIGVNVKYEIILE